jgi:glycosyltransferase involved in cell wall biosynthesis
MEKGYKIKFDVVGKVKDQKVFNIIKNLPYVNYLGVKPKEELINIYRHNDIFVLPSINETFGLVYAEAMSQGLPVIYTKGQGFDGQFKDGEVGYAVRYDSSKDIYEAVIKICHKYNEISRMCVENAGRFNWNKISVEYFQIYSSLNIND